MRRNVALVVAVCLPLAFAASATATPVATSMGEYQAYGAVFPDPLAICQQNCDPNSRGTTNATQFIGFTEFVDGISFMNKNADWQRYMEVWPLDGKKGDGAGAKAGDAMWEGNNLTELEWTPKKEYQSAGLAKSDETRQKSDLIVVRVTDENVPDKNKKRYALSLSIHGIERAGAEGGIRAMEEIVTAVSEGRGDLSILPKEVRAGAPTFREALANAIIYFTLPNPDGWRRGSYSDTGKGPGVFFQRYNGNGIDPNRDWADIGYAFRGYSGASEPETRAFTAFYHEIRAAHGDFAAGDDLHGQPFADALSYTLMPHGRHDIDKDYRIREASKLINRAQYEATKWSPLIIDNDVENQDCVDTIQLGNACAQIYAQTWGSVYDTINYTTTGTLGDWFDSALGIGADGIDNEMSFSHLDKNVTFNPQDEQLHVAGNKAIIYSHLADVLRPPGTSYSTQARNAYVPNVRLTREEKQIQAGPPPGTSPQADRNDEIPTGADPDGSVYEFPVERDANTYNGGMRVDVRATNVQGIGSGRATLRVQCMGCDQHVGVKEDGDWVTVASDFNQSFIYAQAGLTAAVNRPDARKADGSPVKWRALVSAPGGVPRFSVDFSSGPATTDGATGGDDPPFLAGYDVANTDFFRDLNGDALDEDDKFDAVDPVKVLSGEQSLDGYRTLVLADEALPGYTGAFKGEARPTGPPTANLEFQHSTPTTAGQTSPDGCQETETALEHTPFEIGQNDGNNAVTIEITWTLDTSDYDLYLARDTNGNGTWDGKAEPILQSSAGFLNTAEEVTLPRPPAGKYVIVVANCSAPSEVDPWSGTATFTPRPPTPESAYTLAQKDAWMAKLRDWVAAGGNLVLTDGALRALGDLTGVPGDSVNEQTVYVGQTAFQICSKLADDGTCDETKETLDDPLARDVNQPAARFNTGMRRQTFESTPLGYAIQNAAGTNQSFARQFDVDLVQFTTAGGRAAGGSADGGAGDASAVTTRVTLGEVPVGQGQVRIIGALLPQPSTQYDHPLGVEPYALTYTGYILFCNLVDCSYEAKKRPALINEPAPPGPATGTQGNVDRGLTKSIGATLRSPRLASDSLRGRRLRLRIRAKRRRLLDHFVLEWKRTGTRKRKAFKTIDGDIGRRVHKLRMKKKGKVGQTYRFRLRGVAKTGRVTRWSKTYTVYPYDQRGKGRRFTGPWRLKKAGKAWLGSFSRTNGRGARLKFKTRRGGDRIYVIGRTGRSGGEALIRYRGKRELVSFFSKKKRNRRVLAEFKANPKKRVKVVVITRGGGTVNLDGIGVRRR